VTIEVVTLPTVTAEELLRLIEDDDALVLVDALPPMS